ncbi:sialoadhesin-like isoform 2-T2 [Syngnathus typhle]
MFFFLLFGVQVVQALEGRAWGGTYPWIEICALTGAKANLRCVFTYPEKIDGQETVVQRTQWFIKEHDNEPEDLNLDPDYAGRLHYDCHRDRCGLTITELRESDSGTYKFTFITKQWDGGRYTVMPGVKLTVTDLSVQWYGTHVKSLSCVSECSLGPSTSYVWFENGEEIPEEHSQVYTPTPDSKNSFSCAVEGHRQLVSPPVCVSRSCNMVHYDTRSVCALKGASVDINWTYSSYDQVKSEFWFRPDRKHLWTNASVPQDLQLEEQYHARFQFLLQDDGHSILRIENVMESDAAEYRFKFTTRDFEWTNSLPGINLNVAAVQVRVNGVRVENSSTVALLSCHSSCRPSATLSFCLALNVDLVARCFPDHTTKHLQMVLIPGDYVTCHVEGHPLSISPRLYALSPPTVSLSHSGNILEGGRLILNCSSVSVSAEHLWHKKTGPANHQTVGKGPQLLFSSIKASDSGQYFCTAENELGKATSQSVEIDVRPSARVLNIIRLSVMFVLLLLLLLLALCMRKKTSSSSRLRPNEVGQFKEKRHHVDYENIRASAKTRKHRKEDTL